MRPFRIAFGRNGRRWAARLSGAGQLGNSAMAVLPVERCMPRASSSAPPTKTWRNSFSLTAPPNTANSYVLRLGGSSTGLSDRTARYACILPAARGPITVSATRDTG
ncbi:MAG: hypothetical protein IPH60_15020 [Flavobacteriales bacterium]|nr:hypothetical protein [Flavobacteriales bacterium]